MAIKYYKIPTEPDLQKLIALLNKQFRDISNVLGSIQGVDNLTFEMSGIIKHNGTKIGVFNAAPVVQQDHIVDAEISHGSATTTELDALGAKINEILVVLETYGFTKTQ